MVKTSVGQVAAGPIQAAGTDVGGDTGRVMLLKDSVQVMQRYALQRVQPSIRALRKAASRPPTPSAPGGETAQRLATSRSGRGSILLGNCRCAVDAPPAATGTWPADT
jgi:hypothetical protein